MKALIVLFIQLFISVTSFATTCNLFRDSEGRLFPVRELEARGLLLPGAWITDDSYEFRAFPKDVRKAVAAYTRRTKSTVKQFTESLGSVHQLGRSAGIEAGYLVGVEIYSGNSPASLPSFFGAAYDLTGGRPVLLFDVVDDKIVNCK